MFFHNHWSYHDYTLHLGLIFKLSEIYQYLTIFDHFLKTVPATFLKAVPTTFLKTIPTISLNSCHHFFEIVRLKQFLLLF